MKSTINFENEKSKILRFSNIDIEEDFVGVTVEIDEQTGVCKHSGLIICYEQEVYYFHYTGRNVELKQSIPELYFKKLDVIDNVLIASFLWHCEKLAKDVNPIYGFVFDKSYYDSNADYYLINAKFDITTCVGFCIKVLEGFLLTEYLKTDDWGISSLESLDKIEESLKERYISYMNSIAEKNGVSIEEIKCTYKRILPSELFSSTFFTELPIRKKETDTVLSLLESNFESLIVA